MENFIWLDSCKLFGKNSVVMRFGLLLISLLTLSFVAQGQESKSDVFVPISSTWRPGMPRICLRGSLKT